MSKLEELKNHLKQWQVYRRAGLLEWTNAVDRHLRLLVNDGTLVNWCAKVTHLGG